MRFIDKGGALDYTSTVELDGVQKSIVCKGGVIDTKDEALINHIMKFPATYDIAQEQVSRKEDKPEIKKTEEEPKSEKPRKSKKSII